MKKSLKPSSSFENFDELLSSPVLSAGRRVKRANTVILERKLSNNSSSQTHIIHREDSKQIIKNFSEKLDKLNKFIDDSLLEAATMNNHLDFQQTDEDLIQIQEQLSLVETKVKLAMGKYTALKKLLVEVNSPKKEQLSIPQSLNIEKLVYTSHKSGIPTSSLDKIDEFKLLASSGKDGTCNLWNQQDFSLVSTKKVLDEEISSIKYIYSLESLAVHSKTGSLHFVGISNEGFKENSRFLDSELIRCFAENFSEQQLLTIGHNESSIKIWDLPSLKYSHEILLNDENSGKIDFPSKMLVDEKNGVIMLGYENTGLIRCINFVTGETVCETNLGQRMLLMDYMPNRRHVIIRTNDNILVKTVVDDHFEDFAAIPLTGCGYNTLCSVEKSGWIAVDDRAKVLFYTIDGRFSSSIETSAKTISCVMNLEDEKKLVVADLLSETLNVISYN